MSSRALPAIRSVQTSDRILALAFHGAEQAIAGGGFAGTLCTWEAGSGKLVRAEEDHDQAITSVAVAPDGGLLASASYDNTVHLWELPSFAAIQTLSRHKQPVLAGAFAPDGRTLTSGGDEARCMLWERTSWQERAALGDKWSYSICALAFTPDGQRLMCGRDGGLVTIWDTARTAPLASIEEDGEWVFGLAISPDGALLAHGGESEVVTLRRAATLQPVAQLRGHRLPPAVAAAGHWRRRRYRAALVD